MEEQLIEVHPSDVNSALLCELRLDETLMENKPNPDLIRGSLLHARIESFLKEEPFDPLVFLTDRFSEEYGITDHEEAGITDLGLTKVMVQADVAFEDWKTTVLPLIDTSEMTIEVEHRVSLGTFEYEDTRYVIELVGSPDLVDATPVIHDWKTAARMWDPTRVVNQAQPPLYGYLVNHIKRLKFIFWIYGYDQEVWKFLDITPTNTQVIEMLDYARRVAIKKIMGLLTPMPGVPGFGRTRGWWCSPKYCRNWNRCTARSIVNDGNDDVAANWKEAWA